MKELFKKNYKILVAFILGLAISGIGAYAVSIASSSVTYDNTTSGATATDVKGAIDELYNLAKNPRCPSGYTKSGNNTKYSCLKDNISIPVSFADDSWDTIIANVQTGNTALYTVGSTKTVDLGTLGTHILRVANNSTPAECATEGFSQTACGFVLEFADIITTHQMNPYANSGNSNGDGNRGGWEFSEMRAYLNSGKYLEGETGEIDYSTTGIYSSLPENLRNAIIGTTVVSGHGSKDTTNFTTIDKLYLLSTHEVWEDVDENTSGGIDYFDTAYNNTRQLDYYKLQNITTSNYSGANKKYGNDFVHCWLRSSKLNEFGSFCFVGGSMGYWSITSSYEELGVSPAFRIG